MIRPKQEAPCVIWGGYALGNTGDELCLAAALDWTEKKFGAGVTVLTPHPEFTSSLFPSARVVPFIPTLPGQRSFWSRLKHRFHADSAGRPDGRSANEQSGKAPAGWTRCLSQARCLYLAGGGYLTDLFPLNWFLPPIQLANELKLPMVTAPIGIGPFKSRRRAGLVARALSRAELRVRDEASMEFCRRFRLNAVMEPDAAFALVETMFTPPLRIQNPYRPRKIGVCIFSQFGSDRRPDLGSWWETCLRGLRKQHPDFKIEGFCFHTSPDAEFSEMRNRFRRAGLPPSDVLAPMADFRSAVEGLRDYDLIISTQFHAVVAANVFQIPNLAVASGAYYTAKMKSAVAGSADCSRLIQPGRVVPETVLDCCRDILAAVAV